MIKTWNFTNEDNKLTTIGDRIRKILNDHGKLSVDATSLADDADLYEAGLSSFATVQLMLALEDEFDVEIPERLLNRRTFESIRAIAGVVHSLTDAPRAA
jgi:acyl carrier protein